MVTESCSTGLPSASKVHSCKMFPFHPSPYESYIKIPYEPSAKQAVTPSATEIGAPPRGGAPISVADGVTACLADGSYGILMYDSYGDGWNGNILQLWTLDAEGNPVEQLSVTIESGNYAVVQFNVGASSNVKLNYCIIATFNGN